MYVIGVHLVLMKTLVGIEVLFNKIMFKEGCLLGRGTYKANENMTGFMKTVLSKTHSVKPYELHTWCKMFD